MRRYVLTPSAKRDVNDIWDYIAAYSIEGADRVLDALESAMIKLAKNPGVWSLARGAGGQETPFLAGLFVLDRLSV